MPGLTRQQVLFGLATTAAASAFGGCATKPAKLDLMKVNDAWVVSEAEATEWHRLKDEKGPTLTGNESWLSMMAFLEKKLGEYGCVDIHKSEWTFKRLATSMWPDDSKWSLVSNGKRIQPLMNFGANCGTTGPEGVTAELVLWDPDNKPDVAGKIVVFRPRPRAEVRENFVNSDYEYITPFDSWPQEGGQVPQEQHGTGSISGIVWDEMTATSVFIGEVRNLKPAGVVFAMNLNRAATEGLYTFGVPTDYDFPSVYVDRVRGDQLVADAKARAKATVRVDGERVDARAYQLMAFLPGRDYGTPQDEQVQLRTHTDGPSISQDDGALGLLGVVKYMSNVPKADRPRTLLIELDCRHFMPGAERALGPQDYFEKNPRARDKVIGLIAMEHLGQIEYVFDGEEIKPSGRSLPTWMYSSDNQLMIDTAYQAAKDNKVPGAVIRAPSRPGKQGKSQGPWYGMSRVAQTLGIPGYGVQGDLGAYWAHSARLDRFDARSYRRQVATFCQLTGFLMTVDKTLLKVPPPVAPTIPPAVR